MLLVSYLEQDRSTGQTENAGPIEKLLRISRCCQHTIKQVWGLSNSIYCIYLSTYSILFLPSYYLYYCCQKVYFYTFYEPCITQLLFFKESIIFSRYTNNKKIMCILTCVFTITSALFRSIFLYLIPFSLSLKDFLQHFLQ